MLTPDEIFELGNRILAEQDAGNTELALQLKEDLIRGFTGGDISQETPFLSEGPGY